MEDQLKGIGLTKNETKIYLTVLRAGSASSGKIAEELGLHRRNVYDVTERLVKRGLLSYIIKGSVKHFQVTSPMELIDIASSRRKEAEANENDLKALLPGLLQLMDSKKEKQSVSILRGEESRRIIFEDILKSARENCCLGGHTPSRLSINYLKSWHAKRAGKGIKDRIIFNKADPYAGSLKRFKLTELKLMPETINSKTTINIYGNKVAIFFWINDQPHTIWIDNEKVADDFRAYFNFFWQKGLDV